MHDSAGRNSFSAHSGQAAQVSDLEGLDEDRGIGAVEVVAAEGLGGLLEGETEFFEIRGVLRLGVDADRTALPS